MGLSRRRAIGRRHGRTAIVAVLLLAAPGVADTIITDFNAAPVASFNPRDGWLAFGAGTSDSGIIADGSVGNGAFHTADWGSTSWGVGDLSTSVIDLSPYDTVLVDARLVDLGGHSGTALLRFAIDLPGGTEWSTSAQPLTASYQTFDFDLTAMSRTAGGGVLDLANGTPKFIVERNGQSGTARIDLDEIKAANTAAPYALTPVVLNPPPDGDLVQAIWLYAFSNNLRVDDSTASQQILDLCAQEGINRIYFHAFNAIGHGGTLEDNLRTFLATAHASGIAVEALIDGVSEYQSPSYVNGLIDEVLAFDDATPADASDDFDGVHFDIEFWLSSAWGAASNESERRAVAVQFLDNVLVAGRHHLDANGGSALTIGVDLSAHFDTSGMLPNPMLYDGTTQYFLEHVLDNADEVVLMSYIDSSGGLLNWTGPELDMASGKERSLVVACDMQPVPPEVSINSFADNFTPTPFSAMTVARELYHQFLAANRRAALDGFAVFHYDGLLAETPRPRSIADLDGDGEVGQADFEQFESLFGGPLMPAIGLAADADFNGSGAVDMADFARFSLCYTGDGCGCPVPEPCQR